MIFAKDQGDGLASLVKELDKVVAANSDKKLGAFVNFIGDDRDVLEDSATAFVEKHNVQNVPIVVPVEFELGPKNFGVNPQAGVTVMIYRNTKVAANHAVAPGQLTQEKIAAIIADISKVLE